MKRFALILYTILLCNNIMARQEPDTLSAGPTAYFVENLGQWDPRVRYEMQLHDAALFLEDDGLTVAMQMPHHHPFPLESGERRVESGERNTHYKIIFDGATPTIPTGAYRQKSYCNYYLGNDPSRWRSHVGSYLSARYDGLYPGVSLEIYGGRKMMKYNFIVAPGADPRQIVLRYEGVDKVTVDRNGSLVVHTPVRDIVEVKPYVFQRYDGEEREVKSRWMVDKTKEKNGQWKVWIEVGDYDPGRELVIDPTLIFSTYTGSTADNWGTAAAYDSHRNVYTAGLVFGVGYPVSDGAYQTTYGNGADVGIFKFDSTGSQRLYATYLGGSLADMPHSLYVNSFDELIVFGTTGSLNFPTTPGAYQTSHGGGDSTNYLSNYSAYIHYPSGSDIFVSRLSADGSQLQASTYVGGSGNDGLNYRTRYNSSNQTIMGGNDSLYYNYGDGARGEIITDNMNNVYVGSTTFSNDFPVSAGCVQPTSGGKQEGVVFKLDYNLRNMLWSTYLGGNNDDAVYSIDVDSAYNLLVCGGTNSNNFPVTDSCYQTVRGGGSADGFVTKLSYGGERIIASSFVGSPQYDQLYFVRSGRHNEVFLFGQTRASDNSFIQNAGYSVPGAGMLLMRLTPDLKEISWSTVFGTPGRINLSPTAFAADICNRVYAAGWGRDFVPYVVNDWNTAGTTGMETTSDAYQSTTDGQDFYILSLDANANQLEYATFFGETHTTDDSGGGDHVDGGTSRFDRLGTLYQAVCASCGGHNGFPTSAGAWSDSNQSSRCNNALFRFSVTDDFPVAEFQLPPAGCAPYTVQFNNTGRGTSFHWDFGDGTTSNERNPVHIYTSGGIYTVTLVAQMPNGCSTADTMRHTMHVVGGGITPAMQDIACNGDAIQIGVPPQANATYQWLTEGVSDPTIANPWVADSGTYLLRVTLEGCSEIVTCVVKSYKLISDWQVTPIVCHDSATGSVTFHISSHLNPDSIALAITPAADSSWLDPYTVRFTGLAPGNYSVDIDGYQCSDNKTFSLSNPAPTHYEKEAYAMLCNDSCDGWLHITWDAGDTLFSQLCEGSWIVTLTDTQGCPFVDSTLITRDHNLDSLRVWADDNDFYLGQSVQLHAALSSSHPADFAWSPADELDHPDSPVPVATPTDTLTCYTVTVSDDHCSVSDSICIHCHDIICGAPEFVIPNAFTPNNDGINDRICFNADPLTEFSIAIYNRWGQCVFQSEDPSRCWDGTFRNELCLAGVYTYTCHIRCHNGQETHLKGDITLIR